MKEVIVCAMAFGQTVGIDIEKLKPSPISEVKSFIPKDEWLMIENHPSPNQALIGWWIKLESALKAKASGFNEVLQSLKRTSTGIFINGDPMYYVRNDIGQQYLCPITSEHPTNFELRSSN